MRRGILRWLNKNGKSEGNMAEPELLKRLNADVTAAQKARDEARLSALRFIKSAIQYKQVELKKDLTDADVIDVLARQAKQRRESIEGFEKGGRADLVAKEKAELAIVEEYLPKQMSDDELAAEVKAAISESGAASLKEMGKVMAVLNPKVKGKADMGKVSGMVKQMLGGK
jgi:uncharacterized protein YqeY